MNDAELNYRHLLHAAARWHMQSEIEPEGVEGAVLRQRAEQMLHIAARYIPIERDAVRRRGLSLCEVAAQRWLTPRYHRLAREEAQRVAAVNAEVGWTDMVSQTGLTLRILNVCELTVTALGQTRH